MKKFNYKYIYIIKIFLSIIFLSLILYLSFNISSNTILDEQKILFVVNSSEESLELSKTEMLGILDSLDDLDASVVEHVSHNYSIGLVSFAGLAEVEVPFVRDRFLLQKYIEALVPEENFEGKNLDALALLLADIDTDLTLMFPNPDEKNKELLLDFLEPSGLQFMKNGNVFVNFLLLFLLVLLV